LSVRKDKANLFLRSKMIADYILYIDSWPIFAKV
jgi:hypothetical protein